MTIAACYVCPEGVVFGADSTTTVGTRYYDHTQKIFEVGGRGSTLGIVTWGLGGLGDLSYRALISQFADQNQRGVTMHSAITRHILSSHLTKLLLFLAVIGSASNSQIHAQAAITSRVDDYMKTEMQRQHIPGASLAPGYLPASLREAGRFLKRPA